MAYPSSDHVTQLKVRRAYSNVGDNNVTRHRRSHRRFDRLLHLQTECEPAVPLYTDNTSITELGLIVFNVFDLLTV